MSEWCPSCRKAKATCYCAELRPFDSDPRFVILAHPRELRNSVGTGRMLHLSLRNSLLIDGHDFSDDDRVARLLGDPSLHCALLYPGPRALDLSRCTEGEARRFAPPGRRLTLFIVDGTWDLARGMINRSANLRSMPQLRFTPERRSAYGIRRQPGSHCLSTLETAHWFIERFAALGVTRAPEDGAHQQLLRVFGRMVGQQIAYAARNPRGRRMEGSRLPAAVAPAPDMV
jgi:DTW domain-containing protein YfiP